MLDKALWIKKKHQVNNYSIKGNKHKHMLQNKKAISVFPFDLNQIV